MNNNPRSNATDELLALVEKSAHTQLTRRQFAMIAAGIGAGTLAASQLGPLRRVLGIDANGTGPGLGGVPSGSVTNGGNLVVIYLAGGNDGLNTLIPVSDPAYGTLRPTIRFGSSEVLPLPNSDLGLHPMLPNVARRYGQGTVAFIRGIGYTVPDLSHFESQLHWEHGQGALGSAIVPGRDGWLGRWADTQTNNPFRLISFRADDNSMLGQVEPMRLRPWASSITGDGSTDARELRAVKALRDLAGRTGLGALADNVGAQTNRSIDAGTIVTPQYDNLTGSYLNRQMTIAARLLNANVGVRVVGASTGGYDTHREQAIRNSEDGPHGWHGKLMGDLDASLEALFAALSPAARAKTTVLVYSEFGRRPDENGSFGTDHGAASVAMVLGDQVNGGMFGDQPSLTVLDREKNLIPTVDFRSVYATLISRFLGGDDTAVIGAQHQRLLLSKADAIAVTSTTTSSTTSSTVATTTTSTLVATTAATTVPTTVATTVAAPTTPTTTVPAPTTAVPSTLPGDTTPPTTEAVTTIATTLVPTTEATTTVATTPTTVATIATTLLAPTSTPTTAAPTSQAPTTAGATTTTIKAVVTPPPLPASPMPGGSSPAEVEQVPLIMPVPAPIVVTDPVVVSVPPTTSDSDPIVAPTTVATDPIVRPTSVVVKAPPVGPTTTLPKKLALKPKPKPKAKKRVTTRRKKKAVVTTKAKRK